MRGAAAATTWHASSGLSTFRNLGTCALPTWTTSSTSTTPTGTLPGDALLRATAGRLAHYSGPTGVAGRLGGDEFAAVVIDRHGMADDMLAVLGSVLARPAEGLDPAVHTSVSLGWARVADFPGEGLPELLRRADEAMYAAKRARAGVRRAGIGRLFATVAGRRSGRRGAVA